MVEKITSTVQPLARIGDGVLGDGDGGDHSHHDPEDPLGWLRDSIPGRRNGGDDCTSCLENELQQCQF